MSNSSFPMSRVRIFLALGILGAVVLLFYRLRDSGNAPEKTKEAIRKVLDDQAEVCERCAISKVTWPAIGSPMI